MLSRLKEKFPSPRIAQADASLLPFRTSRFNTVLTVHVLHLIPPWREALREFRRVLVPEATYLNVRTWEPVKVSIRGKMREFWRDLLEAQGVDVRPTGLRNEEDFQSELDVLGAKLTEVEVIRYPLTYTVREELDHFASRVNSNTWDIPDAIFDPSMEEMRKWVESEFGDLDPDGQREDEVRFVIDVVRFEG